LIDSIKETFTPTEFINISSKVKDMKIQIDIYMSFNYHGKHVAILVFSTIVLFPSKVKKSKYLNIIHRYLPSSWVGSAGASIVPSTWTSIGALHGPLRLTCFNLYVPLGIKTLLELVDAHASFQVAIRA